MTTANVKETKMTIAQEIAEQINSTLAGELETAREDAADLSAKLAAAEQSRDTWNNSCTNLLKQNTSLIKEANEARDQLLAANAKLAAAEMARDHNERAVHETRKYERAALNERDEARPIAREAEAANGRLKAAKATVVACLNTANERLGLAWKECDRLKAELAKADANLVGAEPCGVTLIADERRRQMEELHWTPQHDDSHGNWELSRAAICYASMGAGGPFSNPSHDNPPEGWPWHGWWKPSPDPIRNLVKAGALLAAEIDRLRRKAELAQAQPDPHAIPPASPPRPVAPDPDPLVQAWETESVGTDWFVINRHHHWWGNGHWIQGLDTILPKMRQLRRSEAIAKLRELKVPPEQWPEDCREVPASPPQPTRTLAELEQAWLDARRAWVSCDNHMESSSAVAWHRMNMAAAALAQAE
jgi:hypothetical protein